MTAWSIPRLADRGFPREGFSARGLSVPPPTRRLSARGSPVPSYARCPPTQTAVREAKRGGDLARHWVTRCEWQLYVFCFRLTLKHDMSQARNAKCESALPHRGFPNLGSAPLLLFRTREFLGWRADGRARAPHPGAPESQPQMKFIKQ